MHNRQGRKKARAMNFTTPASLSDEERGAAEGVFTCVPACRGLRAASIGPDLAKRSELRTNEPGRGGSEQLPGRRTGENAGGSCDSERLERSIETNAIQGPTEPL